MKALGIITARGGSKGVPHKNIRLVGGRPLIAWTLEAATGSHLLDRTIVSTDDTAIADVCKQFGAEVPFLRPAELARDDSPHIDCILHAIDWLKNHQDYRPDYLALLQPTSPLREAWDIDAAVQMAVERNADAVVSVCETQHHPYFARTIDAGGALRPFVACDIDYPRRQDLPPAYVVNGAVYVQRVSTLVSTRRINCETTLAYMMPVERSPEIDTPWDMKICDLLLRERASRGDEGEEHQATALRVSDK